MSNPPARTIDRIAYLVGEAAYPDARAALDDSWRVALLAAYPAAAKERARVRRAAVRAANARPRPDATSRRAVTRRYRALYIAAIVLGATAIGLVAVSARWGGPALRLQTGMLLAGALAVIAVAVFTWLEPRRASGALWGSHAPAVLYLFFAVLWLLFAASVVLFRWDEVDRYEPWPVVVGLLLFCLAGAAAIVLWRRAARADRQGRLAAARAATRDLRDVSDAAEVYAALDAWWMRAGPSAVASDPIELEAARRAVLAHLRASKLITDRDERLALDGARPGAWRERRVVDARGD